MIRGVKYFVCSKCKKRFWALDIELAATVFSAPMKCPSCGSFRTRPFFCLLSRSFYKNYWDQNHLE